MYSHDLKFKLHNNIFFISLLIGIACVIFQNGPSIVSAFLKKPVEVRLIEGSNSLRPKWKIDLSPLSEGDYFFSGGQPRRACQLFANDILVVNLQHPTLDRRNSIQFYNGFSIQKASDGTLSPKNLFITCDSMNALTVFPSEPIILNRSEGIFIQSWRAFVDMILGPFMSFVLLLVVIIDFFISGFKRNKVFLLLFAICATVYSLVLAQIPSLFIDNNALDLTRVLPRAIFSLAILAFFSSFTKQRPFLWLAHFVIIAALFIIRYFYKEYLLDFHALQIILLTTLTLIPAYDMLKSTNEIDKIYKIAACSWFTTQLLGWVFIVLKKNNLVSPAYISALAIMLTIQRIREYITTEQKLKGATEFNFFAAQVAHDLKSPLSVLKIIESKANFSDPQYKELLNMVITRVRTIGNSLMERFREQQKIEKFDSINTVQNTIQELLKEKSIEYSNKNISFRLEIQNEAKNINLKNNQNDIKRIISNIINNAIEAIGPIKKIEININILIKNKVLCIEIKDNGPGIPPQIISKLGKERLTYNKEGGTGLGLLHAKTTLNKIGGDLEVVSSLANGAVVLLLLPTK